MPFLYYEVPVVGGNCFPSLPNLENKAHLNSISSDSNLMLAGL